MFEIDQKIVKKMRDRNSQHFCLLRARLDAAIVIPAILLFLIAIVALSFVDRQMDGAIFGFTKSIKVKPFVLYPILEIALISLLILFSKPALSTIFGGRCIMGYAGDCLDICGEGMPLSDIDSIKVTQSFGVTKVEITKNGVVLSKTVNGIYSFVPPDI